MCQIQRECLNMQRHDADTSWTVRLIGVMEYDRSVFAGQSVFVRLVFILLVTLYERMLRVLMSCCKQTVQVCM